MKTRVLVIDDDELDREKVRRLLAALPVSILEAATAAEGLDILSRTQVDCCLLDQHLPDAAGLDVLPTLKESSSGAPVLLLTGLGDETLAVEALKNGASDYLVKGKLTTDLLWMAIDAAIKERRWKGRVESLQQEVWDFAHTAAHDLKAPIRQARQFAELYRENPLGENAGRFYDGLMSSLDRMSTLVTSLTAYSQAGGGEKMMRMLDLEPIFRQLESRFREEGVEFVSSPVPRVWGHKPGLERLFENLFSNALKFGGRPLAISWGASQTSVETEIWVSDSGPGIPSAAHEKIFRAFKRLHGKSVPGSGIGLATCQRIAEYHKGRLEVESEPGRGATFKLYLPKASHPKDKILLVDDDPAALRRLENELVPDLSVVTSECPGAALEQIGEGNICAVVSDWQMPRMDGIELLQRVRSAHPYVGRILTSHTAPPRLNSYLRSGLVELFQPKSRGGHSIARFCRYGAVGAQR